MLKSNKFNKALILCIEFSVYGNNFEYEIYCYHLSEGIGISHKFL